MEVCGGTGGGTELREPSRQRPACGARVLSTGTDDAGGPADPGRRSPPPAAPGSASRWGRAGSAPRARGSGPGGAARRASRPGLAAGHQRPRSSRSRSRTARRWGSASGSSGPVERRRHPQELEREGPRVDPASTPGPPAMLWTACPWGLPLTAATSRPLLEPDAADAPAVGRFTAVARAPVALFDGGWPKEGFGGRRCDDKIAAALHPASATARVPTWRSIRHKKKRS